MKNLRKCLLLAFVALATTASAQFVNSKSSSSSVSSRFTSVTTDGWNRLYVSYNPSKLKTDIRGADDLDMKGFTLGYLRGFSVTQKLPLYIEAGVAFQYRAYSEDYNDYGYDVTEKMNAMSLNIPVHLLYRFNVTDDFSIEPFFGFDFRFNLSGKYKIESGYGGVQTDSEYNLFDKDEMNDALGIDAFKRFQAGWHIGVNLSYKPVYFGVHYGKDFNEINDHVKVATTYITLGYNF